MQPGCIIATMGRPQEPKPWHSGAIQLRAQGLTSKKIAEALEVPEGTIKAFFSRSTPDRQRDILAHANKIAPYTPPPPPADIQESMMEIMVKVEKNRAETLDDAMKAVKYALALGDEQAVDNKGAMKKAYLAVEAIKALRTGADISVNLGSLPGMKEANDQHTIQIEVVPANEAH